MRKNALKILVVQACASVVLWTVHPVARQARTNQVSGELRTVWDRVYSAPQAARGKTAYAAHCSSCHMSDLSGSFGGDAGAPALRREGFMEGSDLNRLFDFMKRTMPADAPSSLDDEQYAAILAFLLQENSFPPGTDDLKPDSEVLKQIRIVPRP